VRRAAIKHWLCVAPAVAAAVTAIGGVPRVSRSQASSVRPFQSYVCGQEQIQSVGPPTRQAVLSGALACAGSMSIGAVLERGAFVGAIALDETGTVRMTWYSIARAPRHKGHARRAAMLLASGHLAYRGDTYGTVEASLTRAGRRVLDGTTRLARRAIATFSPAGRSAVEVTRRLQLIESIYEQCTRFTSNVLSAEYAWRITQVDGVYCREAHRVLEALFLPGTSWPANGDFLIGRWHCRSAPPPLAGTADVPVRCKDGARLISAGWHIVKEA
jgi:hypothetical protein